MSAVEQWSRVGHGSMLAMGLVGLISSGAVLALGQRSLVGRGALLAVVPFWLWAVLFYICWPWGHVGCGAVAAVG